MKKAVKYGLFVVWDTSLSGDKGVPKSVGQCRIRADIWPHDPQTANRHGP